MTLRYFCCDEQRREALRNHPSLNGIDYLEVLDQNAPLESLRQKILLVRCFKSIINETGKTVSLLTANNVKIEGGERNPVGVIWAYGATAIPESLELSSEERDFFTSITEPNILIVRTDSSGDFSTYRLSLVASPDNSNPPDNFDPILRRIDFSFKVECPSDFDCRVEKVCPPEFLSQPNINYLARDYASFRQLMLDRMALLMPQWKERNPADVGIVLVELLAYVGDRLSYQIDANTTEAYLDTAHRRISARRHGRLLDYFMHDGCNARTWVQLQVDGTLAEIIPKGTQLFTRIPQQPIRIAPNSSAYYQALATTAIIFETVHDVEGLYQEQNEMYFYTWGASECCLPKGATRATLREHFPNLKVGDILIFEEVKGANTGTPEDADNTRRQAVRLTDIQLTDDPLFTDEAGDIRSVTQISWHDEDALLFPLCISTTTATDVSVALGNIVLAEHGQTIQGERLKDGQKDRVPQPKIYWVSENNERCHSVSPESIPPRFYPQLQERPLTHSIPYNPENSAYETLHQNVKDARPEIQLQELDAEEQPDLDRPIWEPRRDLLNSNPNDAHFVVEIETDGRAFVRFGDNQHGDRPNSGTAFIANYRIGNGIIGNIGADALTHIVTNESAIIGIRNPLPAQGGQDPEGIEEVRQKAPYGFRTQERAVTLEDWAEVTERHPEVQKAVATSQWTGSWYSIFVTIDRFGGKLVDSAFKQKIRQFLERYRLAGDEVVIDVPRFVSLEIELLVCVKPNYFRSEVKRALLKVLSDRILPNGQLGVFHPDNFTFGQPVYLSPIYAAAQRVSGVNSVEITVFRRQGTSSQAALQTGILTIERLEIARLENNPNFPEHGILNLIMEGGK